MSFPTGDFGQGLQLSPSCRPPHVASAHCPSAGLPVHSSSGMKVLVIGSGPIVIGQAAEFDYAGTQACKSLREEGHEVVLINSNPATIMTDPGVSDALYI